jgi:diaminohydroxyphosphoribosylaminopyrimidine deaminase/5-amino-6-(5-phosphoribosylamino)uracil reductase
VRVLAVPQREGHVELRHALRRLAREGLTEILVEGGGGLAAALLRGGLVDELHWFSAPRLLGGDGRPALGPLGLRSLAGAPSLEELRVRRVGCDLHWVGRPQRAGGGAR